VKTERRVGESGKMTMSELAGRLGLDKSSVSLALRGSRKISATTRQRVVAAARRLGFRPNLAARSIYCL
jgi:LacI family transcriptional regulator